MATHKKRHRIYFAGVKDSLNWHSAGVPIIPAISKAHDTLIILADYKQLRQLHEWGMPWLFGTIPWYFRFT